MEKSSLKIISNITLKSYYDKNPTAYLPYDLLPKVNKDVRANHHLTEYQKKQLCKQQFWTETVVDED